MKLRTAALVVLAAGFAGLKTCFLLKKKIARARRMAEWRAREATEPRPEYWPIDEPWPAKDGPIMVVLDSLPPIYVLRSGRSVHGVEALFTCAGRNVTGLDIIHELRAGAAADGSVLTFGRVGRESRAWRS